MPGQVIKKRARFFLAVEGESEQSFVRWLQFLSEAKGLHIHLDTVPLGGGGFRSMLTKAIRSLAWRSSRMGTYRDRFLIVDRDREEQGDWPIDKLRQEAARHKITVCVQNPNHEGLLCRMAPGMERDIPDASSAETRLRKRWLNYEKPANAQALDQRFSLDDLLRLADVDADLRTLLQSIGLMAV